MINIPIPVVVEDKANVRTVIHDLDPSIVTKTFEQVTIPSDKSIDLKLVMTQACNLSCSYCPQQKKTPMVKWTRESLNTLFNGFIQAHPGEEKVWRWFGGEPMLFKGLIVQFLNEHKNTMNSLPNFTMEMTTNGTLLDDEFIELYASINNSIMIISLDTLFSDHDWRKLSSPQVQNIVKAIQSVAKHQGLYNTRIIMNSVPEHLEHLELNFEVLYKLGVRDFYLNNILSDQVTHEYIKWDKPLLDKFVDVIKRVYQRHPDIYILFAPETKPKDKNELNCLVGRKGMSVDGSGDLTGCALFSTDKQKINGTETVYANVFKGIVASDFEDRLNVVDDLYTTDPKCKTCDINGLCSMCPLAHSVTSNNTKYFTSTDYCQDIVRAYVETHEIGENALQFRHKIISNFEQSNSVCHTHIKRG